MEHACPQCGYLFRGKELLGKKQPVLKNYRICPHCEISLIVDQKTRRRQIILLILSIILLFIFFLPYTTAKIVTGSGLIVILLCIFYSEKQIKFEIKNQQ
jgi:rubredoxin